MEPDGTIGPRNGRIVVIVGGLVTLLLVGGAATIGMKSQRAYTLTDKRGGQLQYAVLFPKRYSGDRIADVKKVAGLLASELRSRGYDHVEVKPFGTESVMAMISGVSAEEFQRCQDQVAALAVKEWTFALKIGRVMDGAEEPGVPELVRYVDLTK